MICVVWSNIPESEFVEYHKKEHPTIGTSTKLDAVEARGVCIPFSVQLSKPANILSWGVNLVGCKTLFFGVRVVGWPFRTGFDISGPTDARKYDQKPAWGWMDTECQQWYVCRSLISSSIRSPGKEPHYDGNLCNNGGI